MSNQDITWHPFLELKLRKTTGNAFQTFFGEIMAARYGEDYVPVKPYGSLGDKGCDGYRLSDGAVFACYGAQNGAAGSVAKLIEKMDDDFAKAKNDLSGIMKSWHMTNNIIEGLPTEAVLKLKELEKSNPDITFHFLGHEKIRQIMSEVSPDLREKFIGPVARNEDYQSLQMGEVRDTVDAIMAAVDAPESANFSISPVSSEKLDFNNLNGSSKYILKSGRINGPHIEQYFHDHPDPMRGEAVAQVFRDRYASLKAQALPPDNILAELHGFVVGGGEVSVPRQVAAHSLLSFLFESCDIFENVERTEAAE